MDGLVRQGIRSLLLTRDEAIKGTSRAFIGEIGRTKDCLSVARPHRVLDQRSASVRRKLCRFESSCVHREEKRHLSVYVLLQDAALKNRMGLVPQMT